MTFVNPIVAILLLILVRISFALPDDRNQTLIATSHTAQMLQTNRTLIYTGQVVAHQGSSALTADQLTMQFDAQHQLDHIIMTGTPTTFATTLKLNEPRFDASALRIDYYPKVHQVILTGDARVLRGNDSYAAQKIYYDLLTQSVYSPKQVGQRVTMVIEPQPAAKKSV
jgi:lipopolysaccharide export system protein LptA